MYRIALGSALLLLVAASCGQKTGERSPEPAAEPGPPQPVPPQPAPGHDASDSDRDEGVAAEAEPAPEPSPPADPGEKLPELRAKRLSGPFASLADACKKLADESECMNLPDPVVPVSGRRARGRMTA